MRKLVAAILAGTALGLVLSGPLDAAEPIEKFTVSPVEFHRPGEAWEPGVQVSVGAEAVVIDTAGNVVPGREIRALMDYQARGYTGAFIQPRQ